MYCSKAMNGTLVEYLSSLVSVLYRNNELKQFRDKNNKVSRDGMTRKMPSDVITEDESQTKATTK